MRASASAVHGNFWIGVVYIAYSLFITLFENAVWDYGLWSLHDSFCYRQKLFPSDMMHIAVGLVGMFRFFRLWRWDYTPYLTGTVVSTALLLIYSGAPNAVRLAKYEVFSRSHHAFIVFFLFLFLHGPVFFYWSCVPVLLPTKRGKVQFLLLKVEWISPVMAVYFRPLIKDQFKYKEGQYMYLNCPYISSTEWHPFTISSAYDDLPTYPAQWPTHPSRDWRGGV